MKVLEKLLQVFPNTELTGSGIPVHFCPSHLGLCDKNMYCDENCVGCWDIEYHSEEKKGL